ncbi:MAG: heavy metal translocating P-type ATPase [Cytophagales bacterium]|nr:MAG: heavy metal translocating P-type ATPase [Cytophagales bacterium]
MMLSLPDYLSVVDEFNGDIKILFGILSFILALPVFFYSASDYFISAYTSIKTKVINIDLPIALGLTAAFWQSIYELLVGGGIGYMDSLTGLIFFLLVGKWYQGRTYESISFDRDFKSYFPLAACKINEQKEEYVALKDLAINDVLLIRNEEIIPSDSILIDGKATIDYSFVTGESKPITKNKGELLFAGGRQKGASITIKLTKTVSESYLTQLWNKDDSKQTINGLENFTNKVGKYFTIAVLIISALTCLYWFWKDTTVAIHAAISVLIIFCPCTLALAIPFGFGRAMNALGKNGLFLKNTQVIEKLASNKAIVFDKTGTLTKTGLSQIHLEANLNEQEKIWIKSIAQHSTHPLSQSISNYFSSIANTLDVEEYSETLSKGLEGSIEGHVVKLGSASFIGLNDQDSTDDQLTKVYISIDNSLKGYFQFENLYRNDLDNVLHQLSSDYDLHLLSGDNDSEKKYLKKYFQAKNMHFWQSPIEKLEYVKQLGKQEKVLMIGDGLNDAGALIHSHCGISITEKKSSFSPASDAILDAEAFDRLPDFINFSKKCLNRVYWSIAVSMVYNLTGLYFAVQGNLKPLVAALLMPMSSVSVVLFVTIIAPRLQSKDYKPKEIN